MMAMLSITFSEIGKNEEFHATARPTPLGLFGTPNETLKMLTLNINLILVLLAFESESL